MILPSPLAINKCAGLGEGALLGLLLGAIARQLPILSALRLSNPAAYDAALGASVVSIEEHLRNREKRPVLVPGQNPGPTFIEPPPWNLM